MSIINEKKIFQMQWNKNCTGTDITSNGTEIPQNEIVQQSLNDSKQTRIFEWPLSDKRYFLWSRVALLFVGLWPFIT